MSTATIETPAEHTFTDAERAYIDTPQGDHERVYPKLTRINKTNEIRRYHRFRDAMEAGTWEPTYSHWRHGGSYVDNIVYPGGAVGCIASARHTTSGRFEIACPPPGHAETYPTRNAAAHAEAKIALAAWATILKEQTA